MLYEHRKHDGSLPIIGVNTFRNPHERRGARARSSSPAPPRTRSSPSSRASAPSRTAHEDEATAALARAQGGRDRGRQRLRRAHGRRPGLLAAAGHRGVLRGRRPVPPQRLSPRRLTTVEPRLSPSTVERPRRGLRLGPLDRRRDDLAYAVSVPTRATAGRVAGAVDHRGPRDELPGAARRRDGLVHPPGDLAVQRVRGTKNPDLEAIAALRPDLVVANKEENRELDVRRLRADGVPVWVTDIETVPGALDSLGRLFADVLDLGTPDWLAAARSEWGRPVPEPSLDVAVAIWRDPWMAVGRDTFTGDLVARLGWRNVLADDADRYPHVDARPISTATASSCCCPTSPTSSPPTTAPRRSRTRGPRSSAAGCSRGTARVSSGPPRP